MSDIFKVHEEVHIEEPKFSESVTLSIEDLVFFTHAIIIRMLDGQKVDLLSQIAKEQNIKIYAHQTKRYISSKRIFSPFDRIVFACHKDDWDFLHFLTSTIDYFEDSAFYRLFWKSFSTKSLPEPINKVDQLWVLGLQASVEHAVPSYIPDLDGKWIVFEKTESFVAAPLDAGVSALLTVYEDDLRVVTKEWRTSHGNPSGASNLPGGVGYEESDLLYDKKSPPESQNAADK